MKLWQKIILWILGGVFCIVGIYLVLPTSDVLNYLPSKVESNNYSREDFYTAYQDMIIENEQQNELNYANNSIMGGNSNWNGGGEAGINPSILKQVIVEVASNFTDSSGNYVYSNSTDGTGPPTWVDNATIRTINGRSLSHDKWYFRDCSTFVSLVLYYAGIDRDYKHDGPMGYLNRGFNVTASNGSEYFPSYREMQVGDVIIAVKENPASNEDPAKHVGIVVDKDGEYVYIADVGKSEHIANIMSENGRGYSKKISLDAVPSNGWYYNETKTVVRRMTPRSNPSTDSSNLSSGDLTSLAMAVASQFKDSRGNLNYTQHQGCSVIINGRNIQIGHRDCSGFAMAMAYFLGYTGNSLVSMSSSTFYSDTTYFDTVIDTSVNSEATCAELRVGDIICKNGHVAIVVKIDNEKVYFGDCGETTPIVNTAGKGWHQSLNKTQKITEWRANSNIRVKRQKEN